jgi:hypothetical protein
MEGLIILVFVCFGSFPCGLAGSIESLGIYWTYTNLCSTYKNTNSALSGSASFDPSGALDPADTHPVLHAGRVAVITGAASGIGAAAAVRAPS